MGCRMSLKVHFLYLHLDFIPENFDEVSDKQDEHFPQDIKSIEYWYQVFWNDYMKTDDCWMLYRDASDIVYYRKRK
jgi:hypothetical protein